MTQRTLLQFNPYNGVRLEPHTIRDAASWRVVPQGMKAEDWIFNPWNGQMREEIDIRADPHCEKITMPGDEMPAPMPPAPAFLNAAATDGRSLAACKARFGALPELFPGPVGMIETEDDGYAPLAAVLKEAYDQASKGKGKERHANGRPFIDQPIFQINRAIGSAHGAIYQVAKKAEESAKMSDGQRACKELMGSIVYAAAAIILIREFEAARIAQNLE